MKFDLKNIKEQVYLQEGQFLSEYNADRLTFGKGLPTGIFNKKYPGAGATYCEFKAKRKSIIVFPFRRLAEEKAKKYKDSPTLYVGSSTNNKSITKGEIQDWYLDNKDKDVKFAVVADSIKKLVEALESVGAKPFEKFFLVLDEVELLQMQSGFRGSLPLCFDYFKKFKSKCLVSATLLDFSDAELKKLPEYELEVYTGESDDEGIPKIREKEPLEIRVFKENPHWGIANQLVTYFKDKNQTDKTKFFIGLNSIKGISEMLEIFEKGKINASVSVLVSHDSKDNFLKKYNECEIESGVLPSDINITTCINWSGIDVKEDIRAVAISLKEKVHHAFSFENLVQFFGRSRVIGEKMPYTFAFTKKGEVKYSKPKVSFGKRKEQLNGLLDYVNNKIEEKSDKDQLIQAISNTKGGLIYVNSEGNPAVNWLLEDLENYEQKKVKDYSNKGIGLLEALEDRYQSKILDYSKSNFPIFVNFKDPESREEDSLEKFLDNLDKNYDSTRLLDRFLNQNNLQAKRTAAYWYLFGRVFGFNEDSCLELATKMSKKNKPYLVSNVLVSILRFFTRHQNSYKKLLSSIYTKRNNQMNIKPNEIVTIILAVDGSKDHFPVFYESGNPQEVASIIMKDFFGFEKKNPSRPYFKIQDNDLESPILFNKYPTLEKSLLHEVSSLPQGSGLDFNQMEKKDLIDTKF